jgi:hypothetical protein
MPNDIKNYDPNSYNAYLGQYGLSPTGMGGKQGWNDYSGADNWVTNSIHNSDLTGDVASMFGSKWSLTGALGGAAGLGDSNNHMKFSNFAQAYNPNGMQPGSGQRGWDESNPMNQLYHTTGLNVSQLPENVQQEVYNSMSPEELKMMGGKDQISQQKFIAQRLLDLQSGRASANYVDPAMKQNIDKQDKVTRDAAAAKSQQEAAMQKLNAFNDEMQKPLDPNDPYMKAMMDPIRNGATLGGMNSGLGSGWAGRLGDQAVISAGAQLQTQRSQMGLQALQGGANEANNIAQLGQNAAESQRDYALRLAQQQAQSNQMAYQNQLAANQGTGALLGTVGGYIIGGPAGGAIGGRIGAGTMGGMTQQPQGFVSPYAAGGAPPGGYSYSGGKSNGGMSGMSGG